MNDFLQTYHHPKNITFMKGGGGYNPIQPPSSYAAKNGPHRQSQVDKEIKRILKNGSSPQKSKDQSKIHITVTADRLFVFHHHHHKAIVLKMPPPSSTHTNNNNEKWQLLWWWRDYEVATDERVMKAMMAGLQARFEDAGGAGVFYYEGSSKPTTERTTKSITQKSSQQSSDPMMMMQHQPSASEKRKKAAAAAEQRSKNNADSAKKSKPNPSEVIDLT
mmetsp:Transcript_35946/g.58607  ORF Transcript_35946/g.58607 Transcript_35946/m.58607 type:complete len:219 (+) Transcript_35946:178-834(+)